MIALETDELDFAVLPTNAIDRDQDERPVRRRRATTVNYNWIGINVLHENLKDKNVRLAIRYGGRRTVDHRGGVRRPVGAGDGDPAAGDADRLLGGRAEVRTRRREGEAVPRRRGRRRPGAGDERQRRAGFGDRGRDRAGEPDRGRFQDRGGASQEGGNFGQATKEANARGQLFYTGFTSNPDPSWSTVWFTCDQVNVWNWMSWCNKEYSRLDKEAAQHPDDRSGTRCTSRCSSSWTRTSSALGRLADGLLRHGRGSSPRSPPTGTRRLVVHGREA